MKKRVKRVSIPYETEDVDCKGAKPLRTRGKKARAKQDMCLNQIRRENKMVAKKKAAVVQNVTVDLGMKVRDRITGVEGIVMGISRYITGCDHVGVVQQRVSNEGKLPDWVWLDRNRWEVLDVTPVVLDRSENTGNARPGGPAAHPNKQ